MGDRFSLNHLMEVFEFRSLERLHSISRRISESEKKSSGAPDRNYNILRTDPGVTAVCDSTWVWLSHFVAGYDNDYRKKKKLCPNAHSHQVVCALKVTQKAK
jgi:hypothetical protein